MGHGLPKQSSSLKSGWLNITTYLEGLRCNLAFSGGDPIAKLGESLFQNRAHAVINVKPR